MNTFKVGEMVKVIDESGSSEYSVGEVLRVASTYETDMVRCEGKVSGMFSLRFVTASQWVCNGIEFTVGDKVRVLREYDSAEKGDGMGTGCVFSNSWAPGMDKEIGKEFTIRSIDSTGVSFKEAGYGWPLCVLKNLTRDTSLSLESLKQFQRVQTRQGGSAILMEDATGKLYMHYGTEWDAIKLPTKSKQQLEIVAVYAAPVFKRMAFSPLERGPVIWQEVVGPTPEELAAAARVAKETELTEAVEAAAKAYRTAVDLALVDCRATQRTLREFRLEAV